MDLGYVLDVQAFDFGGQHNSCSRRNQGGGDDLMKSHGSVKISSEVEGGKNYEIGRESH